MTSDSQALVLFQPSPVLQAMYTKEVSFRIPWTGPPDVCSHPPTLTLEQENADLQAQVVDEIDFPCSACSNRV